MLLKYYHMYMHLTLCLLENISQFFYSTDFFQKQLFREKKSEKTSECQTVWFKIRPDILLGLIWVQTVCIGYQLLTTIWNDSIQLLHFKKRSKICCLAPID